MRWTRPCAGDEKIVRKFLLFPRSINKEVRWLQWATLKYVYQNFGGWGEEWSSAGWYLSEFVDEKGKE